jgi:hypothetical protein
MDGWSFLYVSSFTRRVMHDDYCNEIEGFINYVLSNLKIISGSGIRCPCKRCKNKMFLNPYIVIMHLLQKGFMRKYLCWFAYEEPYFPYETMVERMAR